MSTLPPLLSAAVFLLPAAGYASCGIEFIDAEFCPDWKMVGDGHGLLLRPIRPPDDVQHSGSPCIFRSGWAMDDYVIPLVGLLGIGANAGDQRTDAGDFP